MVLPVITRSVVAVLIAEARNSPYDDGSSPIPLSARGLCAADISILRPQQMHTPVRRPNKCCSTRRACGRVHETFVPSPALLEAQKGMRQHHQCDVMVPAGPTPAFKVKSSPSPSFSCW
jgi:hypothetical protein